MLPSLTFKTFIALLSLLIFSRVYAADPAITVQLEGVDKKMAATLIYGLSIEQHKTSSRLNQRYVDKLYENGFEELQNMVTVYGYYHPDITGELTKTEAGWTAVYQINLGQPVLISNIDIQLSGEARTDPAFEALITNFPLKVENTLNHQVYESAKKSILTLAASRGYFDGKYIKSKVEVKPDDYSATVYLYYDSGERYLFQTPIFPDTVIADNLLQKMVPFDDGQPYLDADLLALRRNLTDSGYFDSVSIRTDLDERAENFVPLDITLNEKPKHLYTAGIGYGTDTGARLALGWENRYVNKRGHRLSTSARLSQVSNTISADYVMPFWSETIDKVGFNTEYKQESTDTSDSESFAVGSYYQRKRWGWDETGSLKLLQESFDVSEDDESVVLIIPGIGWSRTWADDTLYTRHGGRLSLSLSGASESLLSDVTFGQAVVRGKYIRSISEKGRFITRATVGVTEVNDFSKLPSSLRFFAGGDNSIRGFDYQSLGPEGDDGEVEGGRYLAVGSLEYEHMFVENWGGAIFTDFGNAFNNVDDPIEQSIGVGVRWRSPVGLIRVDIAKAITDEDEPIALHIVIGPDL